MPLPSESRDIRLTVQRVARFIEKLVVKVTLDVTANLKEANPVDTGWSRANWIPSLTRPRLLRPRRDERTVENAQSRAGEQSKNEAGVLAYKLERGSTFVTNNVHYVPRLNEGHSRQAPAGFVEKAAEKAVTEDLKGFRG